MADIEDQFLKDSNQTLNILTIENYLYLTLV